MTSPRALTWPVTLGLALVAAVLAAGCVPEKAKPASAEAAVPTGAGPGANSNDHTDAAIAEGKRIFRYDTFGDEQFWTDTLRLHEVIEKAVDPTTALKVGLKVDADVLPPDILKTADLKSPATTVALLKMNAIVGVQAEVDSNNHITKLGITCAFCHSTVNNSVMPGIGSRMDGWANRDLNVGAIIALSPALTSAQKAVYSGWGPGMYDPRYNIDGKNTPLLLPPIYGLANVTNETYTGDGPMSYWNAYVAVTQMHGQGNFQDARLGINIRQTPDMVGPKLNALRAYQHSLATPPSPRAGADSAMAARGARVFGMSCAKCHVGGSGTDNNTGVLHQADETGMNGDYAARSANKAYRTTPLRGLWQHAPFFHDGSAKTLADVVKHYDGVLKLKLTETERRDLVAYLLTL